MQVLTAGESSFVLVVLPVQSMHVCVHMQENVLMTEGRVLLCVFYGSRRNESMRMQGENVEAFVDLPECCS